MRTVQAAESETRLGDLLRYVEAGETVEILRHGEAVARLVPARAEPMDMARDAAQRRREREDAVERFRRSCRELKTGKMSVEEILASRHEGHRF